MEPATAIFIGGFVVGWMFGWALILLERLVILGRVGKKEGDS